MTIKAKYVHTNIVAQDWKKLAHFYEQVFGCTLVPPERKLSGRWLEEGTGIPDAQIRGVHLRFPGHGNDGPTLEILTARLRQVNPELQTLALSATIKNADEMTSIGFARKIILQKDSVHFANDQSQNKEIKL